jgi:hypothetical protein
LCGIKDRGYQQRTAVKPIGYRMPGRRWTDWHVTPETAPAVAAAFSEAVTTYAVCSCVNWLTIWSHWPRRPGSQPPSFKRRGGCRVAVLLARAGRADEALALVAEGRGKAGGLDAAWAAAERSWTGAFMAWITQTV